jgi:hypothetical protein
MYSATHCLQPEAFSQSSARRAAAVGRPGQGSAARAIIAVVARQQAREVASRNKFPKSRQYLGYVYTLSSIESYPSLGIN